MLTRLQKFYSSPVDAPDEISSFVMNVLLASYNVAKYANENWELSRVLTGIESLPTEVLDLICDQLPPQSVISLHGASKALATKLPLDNAFWRAQLCKGNLHPHLWDFDPDRIEGLRKDSSIPFSTTDRDWKNVAKLLARKRFPVAQLDSRLDGFPPGLWNRCRIWIIVEEALCSSRICASAINQNDISIDVCGK